MNVLVAPQYEIDAGPALVPKARPSGRKLHLWAWALGLWILSGIYLVAPDQQAVVTRFGVVTEPRVLPGIHYALPWPMDSVYKLKVHQLRRSVIGGDAADNILGRMQPVSSEFLTGDQNLLNIRVFTRRIEHLEPFFVQRLDAAGDDGVDQAVLGLKVVVDGGEVHIGFSGDVAEGSGIEAIFPEQLFRSVEDAGFRVGLPCDHTFDLIIRLTHNSRQAKIKL